VLTRAEIIATLRTALEGLPEVLAASLGGSDATGRTDEFSDVDVVVVVEVGAVEAALDAVHTALEELSPIVRRWRLADPTWHGNTQEFLSLRDADPAHFIDLVVQEPSGGERFLEVERHGTAVVLFDRAGILTPAPLDRDALQTRIDTRLAILRERFPLFQTLVTRAVRRGFVAEAAVAYQDHTYRPLIELLRIRHCPERFDFGARYLDRDLPAGLRAAVEALALPGSLAEVESFRAGAQALFDATLAELSPPG
jgi:predicted nucleotidyltransferase